MSIKWYSEPDREFLFPNHRLLGTLLTMRPALLFTSITVLASLFFFGLGHLLGLLTLPISIPTRWCSNLNCLDVTPAPFAHLDVGILYKLNWSLSYTLALPLIFSLAAALCRSVRNSLSELVIDGTIRMRDGVTRADAGLFVSQFSAQILKHSRLLFNISLMVSIFFTYIDQSSNLWNYGHVFLAGSGWQRAVNWNDTDWMHGWTIASYPHPGIRAYMIGNFFYYLGAIGLQALAIFVGCYFVLLFWMLTQCFASIVISDETDFTFVPFIRDPDGLLGLQPIGRMFSTFLVVALIFQIYAFAHRVQGILEVQGMSLYQYFAAATCTFKAAINAVNDPKITPPDYNVLVCLSGFKGSLPGQNIILAVMVFPLIALAWWPLIRLRRYLFTVRKKKLIDYRRAEEQAKSNEEFDRAEYLAKDMEKLGQSSIWPNGFKVGWGFFFILVALDISTVMPPLIVPLLTGGVGLKVLEKIVSSKSDD